MAAKYLILKSIRPVGFSSFLNERLEFSKRSATTWSNATECGKLAGKTQRMYAYEKCGQKRFNK